MIEGACFKIVNSDTRTTLAGFGGKIIITTGYLKDCRNKKVTYDIFEADVYHELGHFAQWPRVCLFAVALASIFLLLFFINPLLLLVGAPVCYLGAIGFLRLLEYDADRYAARFVGLEAMTQFLKYEGGRLDPWYLKTHPAQVKRLKNVWLIHRSNGNRP